MGKELFDASIGLAFSLTAFERYRKSGVLRADLHHVPGMYGRCQGCLQITQGKVVSCYIEDQSGQQHSMPVNMLIQLDNERGPFGWTLTPPPPLPPPETPTGIPTRHAPNASTPKIVALLDLDKLYGWTLAHKRVLFQVYQTIDGHKNTEGIKQALPLPPHVTEEALHVLSTLNVITLT